MRIPPQTVEQIRQVANIVEVISDFISLKKRGTNWMACCPFHGERTPSFAVSPTKNIFKCFGCSKGGDSISFVMEIESCSYTEALRYLAQKYQIPIEDDYEPTSEDLAAEHERESLLALHQFAQEYYSHILHHHIDGQAIGLSYCKERGFLAPVVEKFALGFALPAWEQFAETAQKKGFSLDVLEKAGLIVKREDGKIFDRFRDRFMFPIHSVAGKVIAFGARTLSNDKKTAKYLNSPETALYHKSKVLYGLFQAKKAIREADNCYLVEGYADVISLFQADIQNVVASSGTSLTIEQIRLLKRFTDNVTVLYDSDSAGVKASLRGIDLLLEEGMNVYALHLPDGHDPDSYVRKEGALATQEHLKAHVQDFITFKATLFLEEVAQNPIRKAEVIRDIVQSIVKIPDEIKQSVYFQQCAKLFVIDEQALIAEAKKIQGKSVKQITNNNQTTLEKNTTTTSIQQPVAIIPSREVEKEAIRLMLIYGMEWVEADLPLLFFFLQQTAEINFEHPLYRQVQILMREAHKENHVLVSDDLLAHPDKQFSHLVADVLFNPHSLSPNWEGRFYVETPDEKTLLPKLLSEVIFRLKFYHLDKLMAENETDFLQAMTDEEQDQCLLVKQQLIGLRQQIGKELRVVIK